MNANPAAHTVARGHVRLDRPTIVPNDPAPDPLDGLVRDVFAHIGVALLLIELVAHFGHVISYEDIAVILYGDTPEVRRNSHTPRMRGQTIARRVSRLNAVLARRKKPYVVRCVSGVGYKLIDGDPAKRRQHRHTPAEQTKILQRYYRLRATQPDMSLTAICRKLGITRWTLRVWLEKENDHADAH